MRDRELALAASFVLCSTAFFVGEMRQASNDTLLALFTTLALYAAWRSRSKRGGERRQSMPNRLGELVFYAALGLGFLTKGPIILLLVAVTLLPYLAFHRRLSWGLRRLASGWGMLIFVVVALSLAGRCSLARSSGGAGLGAGDVGEDRSLADSGTSPPPTAGGSVAGHGPSLDFDRRAGCGAAILRSTKRTGPTLSWNEGFRAAAGGVPVVCLVVGRRQSGRLLLLVGAQTQLLRPVSAGHGITDRRGLGRTGADGPRACERLRGHPRSSACCRHSGCYSSWPRSWRRSSCGAGLLWTSGPGAWPSALALSVAVALSAHSWRRGATSIALAPLAAACVIGFLVAYGRIAPQENPERGHRALAEKLGEIVPAGSRTVMFFNEIDEGLWFYARGFRLAPVPRSHPRYNTAFDLAHSYLTERHHSETLGDVEARRLAREKQALFDWLDRRDPRTRLSAHPRASLRSVRPRSGRPRHALASRNARETQRSGIARGQSLRVIARRKHRARACREAVALFHKRIRIPKRADRRSSRRATFPSAPIVPISEIAEPQDLGLCQLCCRLFLSRFSVLPDRDDRQFCRPKVLIQNMKRIQATG